MSFHTNYAELMILNLAKLVYFNNEICMFLNMVNAKHHILTLFITGLIVLSIAFPVSGCAEMFTWTKKSNTDFDSNMKTVKVGNDLFATNGEDMMQYHNEEWNRIETDFHPELRRYFSIYYDSTNEKIIVFGGWDDDEERVLNDLWSFDVISKIWSEITDSNVPAGVQDGFMADIPDMGKSVLFSGTNAVGTQNFFELFDYSTSTWSHIAPDSYIPVPRWGHSLVYIESMGILYLMGGSSWGLSEWEYRNDVHKYNFSSNEWTLLISDGDSTISPRARFATQYDPVHNVILVHGGMSDNGSFFDTWTYDIANNEWNELVLEDELLGIAHSISLMDNKFHMIYTRHYILDDLSLDALYERNDDRQDSLADYDRDECMQSDFFSNLFDFSEESNYMLIILIIGPITLFITLLYRIVRRIRAKERIYYEPTYGSDEEGYE